MCTILLVDDDADLRELWTLVLEAEGHRVVTAADGVAGMASYDKEPPDVVITDLQLPRLPGLALIARMRSLQADARIIAVSGNNAKLRESTGLGASTALSKPVRIPALVAAVRSLVPDERRDSDSATR